MNPLRSLVFRIRPLLGLRKLNTEITDEIRIHLEMATAANRARGMPADEARRAAEREFGAPELATECYRDARGISCVSGWWHDLRHTGRSLARAKLFSAVTVLTLGLGIGSAAAIFSLVDWVLFRSVDYPADVVLVGGTDPRGEFNAARLEIQYQAYREQAESLAEYAFAHPFPVNVAVDGDPVTSGVVAVTPNLLPMLGAVPVLGRSFLSEDLGPGRPTAFIISHQFWREHLQRDPEVLGRKLVINGEGVGSIVGVLPAGQTLPPNLRSNVFIPLFVPPAVQTAGNWHIVFARLKPGITTAQADADLGRIKVTLPEAIAPYHAHVTPHVLTLAEFSATENKQMYWVLVGAVGFLYAIACLNATNLMVVRIISRRRELSIRLALGGGHWRIVRLIAIECVVLATIASLAGVLVANWLGPLLRMALEPTATFQWSRWSLDLRALLLLLGCTALTALIIVAVPAVRILRHDLLDGLKDGGVSVGDAPTLVRLRRVIVVLQAAFAVVLLTGAGLMVQTLTRLQRVALGFDETHLIKLQLALPWSFTNPKAKGMQRLEELREKLRQVPGVTDVAYGSDTLASGQYNDRVKVTTGREPPVAVELHFISENFLPTSGLTLIRGSLGPRWGHGILINQTFARTMFGDTDPIGQILRPVEGGRTDTGWQIFGVVSDVRETARNVPRNHLYASTEWAVPNVSTFIVRVTRTPDGELTGLLKRAVYAYHPGLIVSYAVPMSEAIGWQSRMEKFVLTTLKVLSAIALVLTVAGLFSLLAYTVGQRMTEFGVRQALGATRHDLIALVVRASVALVAVGVGAGLLGAIALSRYLRSLLFETPPYDPVVLGTVAAVLVIAGLVASLVPATRAAKVDVARLLRAE